MRNLDTDKPTRVRQEATEAVYRAEQACRRARYTLVGFMTLVVAAVAFTVVALGIR
jgi:hypothetical protein